jgi:hypothetical protein
MQVRSSDRSRSLGALQGYTGFTTDNVSGVILRCLVSDHLVAP